MVHRTPRGRGFTPVELPAASRGKRKAFTLVELLVVIGIIALLIGILIPVVSKVRISGYVADSKNWIGQLQGAIDRYHTDFRAYPGPLSYQQVHDTRSAPPPNDVLGVVTTAPGFDLGASSIGTLTAAQTTGSENLVLGLLGGLKPNPAGAAPPVLYDPTLVGLGPMTLNPNGTLAKRYPAYLDPTNLSWKTVGGLKTGHYFDDAAPAGAVDTIIPEFVDRFPDAMPILYLRCRVGVDPVPPNTANGTYGPLYNGVITNDVGSTPVRAGPYDLSQIIGYTGPNTASQYIGTGRTVKSSDYVNPTATPPSFPQGLSSVTTTPSASASLDKSDTANYKYPYDAFAYFLSPNFKGLVLDTTNYPKTPLYPRQKDGYMLISPGPDRTYGTNDDICSFGDVNP